MSGNRDVYLSAPQAGAPWEGILIYQDRNAPPSGDNKLTGNGSIEFDGVIYIPSQALRFGGNKAIAYPQSTCSHLIASTIRLHGNSDFRNECEDFGVRGAGSKSVRLVR